MTWFIECDGKQHFQNMDPTNPYQFEIQKANDRLKNAWVWRQSKTVMLRIPMETKTKIFRILDLFYNAIVSRKINSGTWGTTERLYKVMHHIRYFENVVDLKQPVCQFETVENTPIRSSRFVAPRIDRAFYQLLEKYATHKHNINKGKTSYNHWSELKRLLGDDVNIDCGNNIHLKLSHLLFSYPTQIRIAIANNPPNVIDLQDPLYLQWDIPFIEKIATKRSLWIQ